MLQLGGDGHRVADTRDGLPLKGGGGGVEGTGGTEEQALPTTGAQAVEKIAGEYRGGTAAAGAPAVDVLAFQVKDQQAAVGVARDKSTQSRRNSSWSSSLPNFPKSPVTIKS